jgi:hypothetical protein
MVRTLPPWVLHQADGAEIAHIFLLIEASLFQNFYKIKLWPDRLTEM